MQDRVELWYDGSIENFERYYTRGNNTPMEFVYLGICLVLSFFFSGSETALTAVNRMKVQLRAEQGDRASQNY